MGLQTPGQFNMDSCPCHICHGEIREDQHAVEHMGHGQMSMSQLVEGAVTIWMHPECATVLALRLAHDVMRIKNAPHQPKRVVDELQDFAKLNVVR